MVNAVTYILRTNAAVQAIVGLKTTEGLEAYYKIYPVVAPANEKDAYCAVRISGKSHVGKDCDYEYQIGVASYETSYDEVTTLNNAVIAALTGQAPGTVNGVSFGYLNFDNEVDGYDVDRRLFYKITTFSGMAN